MIFLDPSPQLRSPWWQLPGRRTRAGGQPVGPDPHLRPDSDHRRLPCVGRAAAAAGGQGEERIDVPIQILPTTTRLLPRLPRPPGSSRRSPSTGMHYYSRYSTKIGDTELKYDYEAAGAAGAHPHSC